MKKAHPTLIVMAKAPIMGRAKTRLARDIGPAHAQRLYRMMMTKVLRQTQRDTIFLRVCAGHMIKR